MSALKTWLTSQPTRTAAEHKTAWDAKTIETIQPRISSLGIAAVSPALSAAIRGGVSGVITTLTAIPSKTDEQLGLLLNLETFMGWWNAAVPIEFSNTTLIALVDTLTGLGAWSSDVGSAMKTLGIARTSQADVHGNATEEQIETTLAEIATETAKQQAIYTWGQIHAHVMNEIIEAGGTIQDAKDYVAGV